MTAYTEREFTRDVQTMRADILTHVDISQMDDARIDMMIDWAVSNGLTASQFLRLCFMAGLDAISRHPQDIGTLVSAVTGRTHYNVDGHDDLSF